MFNPFLSTLCGRTSTFVKVSTVEIWAFDSHIFMHSRVCLLSWTTFLVDNHFHCLFATIFPLFRRKDLAGYVAFMMKSDQSHLLILRRKGLTSRRLYCRPGQRGNLVNVSVKQYMNRISVPATRSLLVVAIYCAPASNIHFRPTWNTSTWPEFEYVSMDTPLDHQY